MEHDLTALVTRLVLELAVILVAAKLGGEIALRYLKTPPVLGELVVGVLIGPFALGAIPLPLLGPLFPLPQTTSGAPILVPVSSELYSFAQVASIVLLFVAGLETDSRQFFRYAGPASVVAMGGVIAPFFLGAGATVLFGFASSLMDQHALFMGAVMTATSVGITARVLADLKRLDSPEGVTILGAAVVDDVLGILILTIVVGIAASGTISVSNIGVVTAKAVLFWVGLTGGAFLLSSHISKLFLKFKTGGAPLALALALAFLASVLAESFGLAMIIGAYSIGLALSSTQLRHHIEPQLIGVYDALVPVFFVVMGMMVNVQAVTGALLFGIVISALAVVGKIVGCGLPSLAVGFNPRGALRIGFGMLPRGEVALIVAGVGLTRGVITETVFGVAILMTLVTTLMAPPLLQAAFKIPGPGRRGTEAVPATKHSLAG
ncbi:MAG: cation:proton antiporter [Dehalococcoidia bacterium]|nr:cation:proton antiporter [Dehalococcoidia bacterium]